MKDLEYEFYEKVKNWDFSMFNVISEYLTNWDMYKILRENVNKKSKILDLGTGGGENLLERSGSESGQTEIHHPLVGLGRNDIDRQDRD